METVESVVFLALCVTIPTLMIGVLVYRGVRWAVLRGGWRRTLEERGWTPDVDEEVIRVALEDAGVPVLHAHLSWLAGSDGAFCARLTRRRPGRHRAGETRRLLVVPRDREGPRGVIQPRMGGLLERAALTVSKALAAEPRELDGWEWALVMPTDDDWLDPTLSPGLKELLADGERLSFGPRWIALSLPDGEMPPVLGRLEPLRRAVAGARDP